MSGLVSRRVQALRQIESWPVSFAAAGVVTADGGVETRGDTRRAVRLASVSKPVAALAVLVAAEEGVVDLDEAAGPPGSTVRHLLAHASGLPFEGSEPIASPGRRRIYSNEAFRVLARAPRDARRDAVRGLRARRGLRAARDRPRPGRRSRLRHARRRSRTCWRSPRELLAPRLVAQETLDEMTAVHFPGLSGVLPDYGRFDPLDWGLGVQLNTRPRDMDGHEDVGEDVRALRRLGDVRLGRSGGAGRMRGADGSRVRRVGEGSLARALGCRVGRARRRRRRQDRGSD